MGGFDELVADLHDAASDLNKIAGTLEVATDRGEINSDLPQTVADWLYKIAEDIEHAAICLPLHPLGGGQHRLAADPVLVPVSGRPLG